MGRIHWVGVLLFGCLLATHVCAQTQLQTDEQTLTKLGQATDAKSLIAFFEKGTLKEGEAAALEALAHKLDSTVFRDRDKASRDVIDSGPKMLPFLKAAMGTFSLEGQRRAENCVKEIESTLKGEKITAAARVLAARKDPAAAKVLFDYLPSITTDPFLEEELLTNVGKLTVQPDKVDPLIVNALKDPFPFRRNVAAYLVGRRGGTEYRAQLRELLADKDATVRQRVAEGLFGKRPPQVVREAAADDDRMLRAEKIEPTRDNVLAFLRKRTLGAKEIERLRGLVKDLGSRSFTTRVKATKELIAEGTPALPFLKLGEFDSDIEMARRARFCLDEIRRSTNPAVPMAAARYLARPSKDSPSDSIRALLAYIPFADDENVEDEVLNSLTILCLRETQIEPDVVNALGDANPIRRGAAAFILGHVGAKDDVAKVLPLLKDEHPIARLRATQGILATRNRDAIEPLVHLIKDVPDPYLPRVEETLFRLAEEKGPSDTIVASSAPSREKAVKAWEKWLAANQAKIDLTVINDSEAYLGLITICEYDNQVGNIQSTIWETSRGGNKRFSFGNGAIQGAMDAQSLPNGRILVAENNFNRVTERDTNGKEMWTYQCPVNPICTQRLPNGNTFISSYNMAWEIRPDKTEVYRLNPGPQYYMFGARKAKNGHIVAITAQGFIIELETPSGKMINQKQVQTQGQWCSAELMPNGNYLVASFFPNNGSVREIDRNTGGDVWSKPFPGAFRATRLPNGNVLVASMQTRQVAEMDRAGTIRWSVNCTGRPWGIHYR